MLFIIIIIYILLLIWESSQGPVKERSVILVGPEVCVNYLTSSLKPILGLDERHDIHYRNCRLCRVPATLPSTFYRALGKEGFAECRAR
jgi:hypothetical protein